MLDAECSVHMLWDGNLILILFLVSRISVLYLHKISLGMKTDLVFQKWSYAHPFSCSTTFFKHAVLRNGETFCDIGMWNWNKTRKSI